MRLIHAGRPSELLLEGDRTYRQGDTLEVARERGEFLLASQPVPLREANDSSTFTGSVLALAHANDGPNLLADSLVHLRGPSAAGDEQTQALTTTLSAGPCAAGSQTNAAPLRGAENDPQREASSGEAQSIEGDPAS